MGIVRFSHVGSVLGENGGTSPSFSSVGCSLIVAHVSSVSAAESISDSAGNTWVRSVRYSGAGIASVMYYVLNPITSLTHTVTSSGAEQFSAMCVAAFTGVAIAGYTPGDVGASAPSGASVSEGSLTPFTPNDLFIAGWNGGATAGTAPAIDSSFITSDFNEGANGSNYASKMAYKIKSSDSTAENPNWTWSGGQPCNCGMLCFKAGAATSLGASPASAFTGVSGLSVALTGVGTAWTAGTPGTPTFTLTGGTGASITAQIVGSATAATITVTTGSAAGTLTITDPSTGATATISITVPIVSIPFTNAAMYCSPYNWDSDGAGALQANNVRAASTYIRTVNHGAYFKTIFSGTSAKLNIDTSGITSGLHPILQWSVDSGAWQTYQLVTADTQIVLATGQAAGNHTLLFIVRALDNNVDGWSNPTQAIKLSALILDPAATVTAPSGAVGIETANIIAFGDSITGGANDIPGATAVDKIDAYQSYVTGMAQALQAEYGNLGLSGAGWLNPVSSGSNVPIFGTSWNLYYAGRSRLFSGKLSPMPDYVTVAMGTNDAASITTTMQAWIAVIRAAVNLSTPIFFIVPFRALHAAEIASAITGSADAHCFLIDLGPGVAAEVPYNGGGATRGSIDNIHPNANLQGRISVMITRKIQLALTAANPAGVGKRRLF